MVLACWGHAQVAPHLGRLTSLDLRDCNKVSDEGVALLARHLSNLTSLDLQYCPKVRRLAICRHSLQSAVQGSLAADARHDCRLGNLE